MPKAINPFSFSALPKLSSADLQMANRIPDLKKILQTDDRLIVGLQNTLQTLTRENISFSFDNLSLTQTESYSQISQAGNCFAVLSHPLKNDFIFLETDANLAKNLIYKMLGGDRPSTQTDRLSEVESGLLNFIILKMLNTWQSVALKLVELGTSFDIVKKYLKPNSSLILLNYKISSASFCRITMSYELMGEFLNQPTNRNDDVSIGLRRCAALQIPVVAEVGSVHLKPSELGALDIDDIIVLEDCGAHLKEPGLVGNVQAKIGTPEQGSFKGNILLTKNGRYALQVSNLVATSEPQTST